MIKKIFFIASLFILSSMAFAQGLDNAFVISTSGLVAQKVRFNVIAENVANLSTFEVAETGLPYQKQYAVLEPGPAGVQVVAVEKSTQPFTRYYDPAAPQTDKFGYYYFPNVNLPDEMVNLAFTETMFEANLSAIKMTKTLYQSTIDALK